MGDVGWGWGKDSGMDNDVHFGSPETGNKGGERGGGGGGREGGRGASFGEMLKSTWDNDNHQSEFLNLQSCHNNHIML